jgi:lipoprotein-anchoring transpeptidase ErfK/SrfK
MEKSTIANQFSRRDFLKISGLTLIAAILSEQPVSASDAGLLARVVDGAMPVYEKPSLLAKVVTQYWKDMVLPIAKAVDGEQTNRLGPVWYQVGTIGFAHASWLQPVQIQFQEPTDQIRFTGSLAEVTVPFVDVYASHSEESPRIYRYYYSSTHWVNKLVVDRDGKPWYRVVDDKFPDQERWVRAERLRIFPDEALAPISPDVPAEEKLIEVNLAKQHLTAYEYGNPVFEAPVSTGDYFANPKYQTPTGSFLVGLKRPSQHMLPWDRTFGSYDLPGVPWVSYFTQRAHAFHGAYWHNGFGRIRSHGCVNLAPQDARWVYLWTTPEMRPYNELQYAETGGTRVHVIEDSK